MAAVEELADRCLTILLVLEGKAGTAEAAVDRATALVDEFRPMVESFLTGKLGRVATALLAANGRRTIETTAVPR